MTRADIGACCGDLATTDSQGKIRVDNFYPEEIDSLYLTDKSGTCAVEGQCAADRKFDSNSNHHDSVEKGA